jgi:hypothetical protein
MPSAPYLVSRILSDGSSTPIGTAPSREAANEWIAKLEDADPKGSLVWYSREPLEVVEPKSFRAVKSAALALAFAE